MAIFIFRPIPEPKKKERLSKQDKIMLRNQRDNTMLYALKQNVLDSISKDWMKYGR
jgi:hypothetical protein